MFHPKLSPLAIRFQFLHFRQARLRHAGLRCALWGGLALGLSCGGDDSATGKPDTDPQRFEPTSNASELAPSDNEGAPGAADAQPSETPAETDDLDTRVMEGTPNVEGGIEGDVELSSAPADDSMLVEDDSQQVPSPAEEDTPTEEDNGCPFSGNIVYRLNGAEDWPQGVPERLSGAMDEALAVYNCYADLSQDLTVNYNPGVPTAEANVDGWMSFGSDRGYMVVATAMHEVAHTLGVGFFPWTELLVDGRWTGEAVNELLAELPDTERDPDQFSQRDFITADRQHFWPYGLNQSSEHQSEWSLINHVRLVAAMQVDKQTYRDAQR